MDVPLSLSSASGQYVDDNGGMGSFGELSLCRAELGVLNVGDDR